MRRRIVVDIDDTLIDFENDVRACVTRKYPKFNIHPDSWTAKNRAWFDDHPAYASLAIYDSWRRLVKEAGAGFWETRVTLPGADGFLLDLCRLDVEVVIATMDDPQFPDVIAGKRAWLDRWRKDWVPLPLGPVFVEDKSLLLRQPGDILVDDQSSRCEWWRDAGGIAYQPNMPSCIVNRGENRYLTVWGPEDQCSKETPLRGLLLDDIGSRIAALVKGDT